jgi:hypothetical protein
MGPRRSSPPTLTAPISTPPGWSEASAPNGRIVYSSFHGNQPLPNWYQMNSDGTGIRSLPQLQGAGDLIDWLAQVG